MGEHTASLVVIQQFLSLNVSLVLPPRPCYEDGHFLGVSRYFEMFES